MPTTEEDIDYEGSVKTKDESFVRYPDGLTVRIHKVERLPDSAGVTCTDDGDCQPGVIAGHELIRVGVSMEMAEESAPLPLEVTGPSPELFVGPNREATETDCGFSGGEIEMCTETSENAPTRVAPGNKVIWYSTFIVPEESKEMALTVYPGEYLTDFTFTDVETLLKP
ncbi:hypothetical protein [Streptomyces sp. NPDC060194]|uniref:hypothetical protein n=1 Tax=Streptomyces sp. NPDC060194 TaxID=3347069 RepID=UPI003646E8A9